MIVLRRQMGRHRSAQRLANEDYLIGLYVLGVDEPGVSGLRGSVATGFSGLAFALAVARVVEDQDRFTALFIPGCQRRPPQAEVAAVAVAVECGTFLLVPAGRRRPPRVQSNAIGLKIDIFQIRQVLRG